MKIADVQPMLLAAQRSVHDGCCAGIAVAVAIAATKVATTAYLVHVFAYSKASSSCLRFQLNCQNCESRAS